MNSQTLEKLKKLESEATEGPWVIDEVTEFDADEVVSRGFETKDGKPINEGDEYQLFSREDSELITELRNNAKELIRLAEIGMKSESLSEKKSSG